MTPHARCRICQCFVVAGASYCVECAPAVDEVPDDRDEAYERAAARARDNDFAETGGKDWT